MPRRFCAEPGCRAIFDTAGQPGSKCAEHAAVTAARASARRARAAARRLSSSARGYGSTYRRNRDTIVALAIQAALDGRPHPCAICTLPCQATDQLTAQHLQAVRHGGSPDLVNLGPAHAACNTGWNRGHGLG